MGRELSRGGHRRSRSRHRDRSQKRGRKSRTSRRSTSRRRAGGDRRSPRKENVDHASRATGDRSQHRTSGDGAGDAAPRKQSKWDQEGSSSAAAATAGMPAPHPPPQQAPPVPGQVPVPPGLPPGMHMPAGVPATAGLGPAGPAFKVLTIPANQTGALIGKGGAAITAIRQASMSEVKVTHSEGEALATVTITGNVALAEKLITDHLTEVRRPKSVQWEVRLLDVPQELVGQTIGPGGSNLREIKDKSGCQIAFVQAKDFDETAPEGKQLARIKGPPEKVPEAEQLLIEKVQEVQQIHINKSMNRQMSWGYGGGMHMGGGACGEWSHWVHNGMSDGMQATQVWMEDPLESVGAGFHDEQILPQQQKQQQQQQQKQPQPQPQKQAMEHASAGQQAVTTDGQAEVLHRPGHSRATAAWDSVVERSPMSGNSSHNSAPGAPPPRAPEGTRQNSPAFAALAAAASAAATATAATTVVESESTAPPASAGAGAATGTPAGSAAVGFAPSASETWWHEAGSGGREGKGAAAKGMAGPALDGFCVMEPWGMSDMGLMAVNGYMDAWGMDGAAYPPDASGAWGGQGRLALPCRYQMQGPGACRNGETMAFSHPPEALGAAPGMGGGMAPEVVRPEDYKMTYCKFWDSGQCTRGEACPNAHGIDELRGGLTPKNVRIMEEAQELMMARDAQGGGAQPAAAADEVDRGNVPAAFRTVAFQQRLQQTVRGPTRLQGWP